MKKVLSVLLAVFLLAVVFCISFTAFAGEEKNGFVRENGAVYYYVDGELAPERWVSWNGNLYYVDYDGKVVANKVQEIYDSETDSYASYYFDSKGVMQKGGFITHVEKYSYEDADGKTQTYSNTYYYYAYANGKLAMGWTKIGNYTYYFQDYTWNPAMYCDGINWVGDIPYLFTKGGILKTKDGGGWLSYTKTDDDGTKYTSYYYSTAKGAIYTGWKTIDGNKYYLFPERASGVTEIGDNSYYFTDKGVLKTGWIKHVEKEYYEDSDGKIQPYTNTYHYYAYSNGKLAKGWTKIGNYTYYFQDYSWNPYMSCDGINWVGNTPYLFTKGGILKTKDGGGWLSYTRTYDDGSKDTSYYYSTAKGAIYTGWKTIGGNKYYLYPQRATGINEIDGKSYYFTDKGVLKTGWIKHVEKGSDWSWTDYYCATKTGILLRGWQTIGGKKYYFSDNSWNPYMYKDGLYSINDKSYLFNTNGVLLAGGLKKLTRKYDNGETWSTYYYTDKNGVAYTGWKKINGNQYYFGPEMYRSGGHKINDKIYVFNKNGTVVKSSGWFKISETYTRDDGKKYTVNDYWYLVKGVPKTGWQKIDGKWYYFDTYSGWMYSNGGYQITKGNTTKAYVFEPNGSLTKRTGWISLKSASGENTYKFYVTKGGIAKTGFKQWKGNYYYFSPSGYMVTGVYSVYNEKTDSHKTYLFKSNGVWANTKTGWYKDEYGSTFYFIKGVAKVGWKVINGNSYCFNEYGEMYKGGTYYINGKNYTFRANGTLVK